MVTFAVAGTCGERRGEERGREEEEINQLNQSAYILVYDATNSPLLRTQAESSLETREETKPRRQISSLGTGRGKSSRRSRSSRPSRLFPASRRRRDRRRQPSAASHLSSLPLPCPYHAPLPQR